jgi:prevent-host-death family protein
LHSFYNSGQIYPLEAIMQHTWQIQEAKNRFSELVNLSLSEGPQTITRHGKPVAQIVPIAASAAPPVHRKAKTFEEHMLALRDLPPGPDLELSPRWNRSLDRMVSFDE